MSRRVSIVQDGSVQGGMNPMAKNAVDEPEETDAGDSEPAVDEPEFTQSDNSAEAQAWRIKVSGWRVPSFLFNCSYGEGRQKEGT